MTLMTHKMKLLRGGVWGPLLILLGLITVTLFLYFYYGQSHFSRQYGQELPFNSAMFGPALEQPIAFSHRLHISDKKIDCFYCHSYGERSLNAGVPSVQKCLGCHDHIIPLHEEISKLKKYREHQQGVPWVRVYYKPDHVYFPHFRHLHNGVRCQECHGEVEKVDRLHQVTFYMGFCLQCHRQKEAPLDCWACHQ
jgi:hypothetical protein